jgi:hypothetical protein
MLQKAIRRKHGFGSADPAAKDLWHGDEAAMVSMPSQRVFCLPGIETADPSTPLGFGRDENKYR